MKFLTFTLILFILLSTEETFSSLPIILPRSKTHAIGIVIQSTFIRNKKVWNSYKLSKRKILKMNFTKNEIQAFSSKTKKKFKETIIFKNKNFFIISSKPNIKGNSELKVATFPCKINNNNYSINLKKDKERYLKIRQKTLTSALSKIYKTRDLTNHINFDKIKVGKMNCKKSYSKVNCKTLITIDLPKRKELVFPQEQSN